MEFEWDETKNQQNLAKHGFDFASPCAYSTDRCAAMSIFGRAMSSASPRPGRSEAGLSRWFISGAMDGIASFLPDRPGQTRGSDDHPEDAGAGESGKGPHRPGKVRQLHRCRYRADDRRGSGPRP